MAMRSRITVLLPLLLGGCLLSAPPSPPLAEKGESTRQKAAQLFRECRTGLALTEYRKVLYLAELRDDRPAMATALLNVGIIQLIRGELVEAEQALRTAQPFFHALDDLPGEQQVTIHLATLRIRQGAFAEGLQMLQPLWEQLGGEEGAPSGARVRVLNGLAIAHKESGRFAEAGQWLLRAEREAVAVGNQNDLATVRMNHARLLLQQGALAGAHQQATEALALDRATEHLLGIGADLLLLGLIAERQGETAQAQAHWRQAGSIWDYCGLDRQRIFGGNGIRDPKDK
ncbi:MAG: tetratricopeptide repeat protein [Magnetococcales bacterium]|nr:tetratricopeptide repeat protein [Magnetococcales bacterium]MBF0116541.1 tetratricopeptide repeat protein [Magnetococcales bacterium]